jgi:hypothetical protein
VFGGFRSVPITKGGSWQVDDTAFVFRTYKGGVWDPIKVFVTKGNQYAVCLFVVLHCLR